MLLFLLALLLSSKSFSEPSNIRLGYVACGGCHVNPNGSQILTEYGRVAGIEMSTWGYEKEALGGYLFDGHGLLQVDLKHLTTSYRNFVMQLEAQAAIKTPYVTVYGSGGQYGANQGSRSHYIMATYDGFSARAGKFLPTWNINIADHSSFIRKTLGLTPGLEEYSGEIAYEHDYGSILLGGNKNTINGRITGRLKRFEAGISGMYRDLTRDYVYGGFINYGPIPYLHLYLEANNITKEEEDEYGSFFTNFFTGYSRIGVFPIRGVDLSLTRQIQTDLEKSTTELFTGGLAWSPRPHMRYSAEYGILKVANQSFPHTLFLVHLWL